MSLILDGSVGVSDVDGSAATPAIRGTDANTGMFFPAADTIAFSEGGVESMRIDSSGNVGIGTNSPNSAGVNKALTISGTANAILELNGGATRSGYLFSSTATGATILSAVPAASILQFNTVDTERMRIDSSGKVGIGTAPSHLLDIRTSIDAIFNVQSTGTIQSAVIQLVGRQSSADSEWDIVSAGSGLSGPQFRIVRGGWTGGSPEFVINTNGAIALKGGSTAATGVGITFPGTQSASADANTLDDYEEGTWTPEVNFGGATTGITYFNRQASYTKVGNMVTIQVGVYMSSKGSATGSATITGCPFTSVNASFGSYGGIIYGQSGMGASGMPYAVLNENSTIIYLQYSNAGGETALTNSTLATYFQLNITYRAAS
jgi:hypothetical protein